MKRVQLLGFLAIILCQSQASSQSITTDALTTNPCSRYTEAVRGTLGTYSLPPRFEDGRIDQKRLIAELKDIHANTYNWLIRTNHNDLEALKNFLPLARKAKLKVWATLVPPSEPPASEPYKLDYEEWATQLASLSLAEPNLIAWSIDDFVHNLKLYTPEYVMKFLSAACSINPKFAFIPCCYFKQTTQAFVTNYGHLFNGILFPYRAESSGMNLQDANQVENEIAKLREMFGPDFPIILDIYASGHSRLGNTTTEYVKEVLVTGMKKADGVLIFCHQDPVKSPEKYQVIKKGFRHNPKMKKSSRK
jgi:hypothetical protein